MIAAELLGLLSNTIELYDDATMAAADYMLDSNDCAGIVSAMVDDPRVAAHFDQTAAAIGALRTIHTVFSKEIKCGHITYDKKYAVEIAAIGLAGLPTVAPLPREVVVETVREVMHTDVRAVLEQMLTFRNQLIDGDALADAAKQLLEVLP